MLIMRYLAVLVMWGTSLSLGAWGQTVTNGTVMSASGNITETTLARAASTGFSTVNLTSLSTATLVNGTSASALSAPIAVATTTSNLSRPIIATTPAEFSNTAFTAVAPGATGTVVSGPNDSGSGLISPGARHCPPFTNIQNRYIASALPQRKIPFSMMVLGLSICARLIFFQG
ncbi:BQ5605_C031g10977 [Microbotryum silenes-dioicae]|uniref:BQ5605_C031g10977 protein n=1 Tax=Microbotryum silenes-dioicae TaxID=796604 RepID=A0A2X0N3T4_9BASI|nr:BQ5605_C031g10977 [Microbotryum silenes-dioicae]